MIRSHAHGYGKLIKEVYKAVLKYNMYNVMIFNYYNVAVLLSARQCLCSTVCGLMSKGVSFTWPIACRLLYYLMELAILLLKLRNISIEAFTYLLDGEPLNYVTKHSYIGVLLT